MAGGIGLVFRLEGKNAVQGIGVKPDGNAQEGKEPHAEAHAQRGIVGPQAGILLEKHEPRELDAGVEEHARGSGHEQEPHQHETLVRGCRRFQGLADKAGSEREGGDRQCADDAVDGGDRHGLEQPPEIGALAFPGHVKDAAGGHQQQRLVDDVGKGVGGGTVQGQFRADADGADHETHLVDDAVREDSAHVVFQQGVDDAVEHHVEADPDQNLCAGKADQQGEHGGLGGERAQKDHAARAGFRIGVGNPGGQRRSARVDQETDQDQDVGGVVRQHGSEVGVSGHAHPPYDPRHQDHAAEQVDQQVAEAGIPGAFAARRPDHQGGTQGHDLPEDEQGDQVATESHAHGGAGVHVRRDQFRQPGAAHGVGTPGECHEAEDDGEQAAARGGVHRRDPVVEKLKLDLRADGQGPNRHESQQGQGQDHAPAHGPPDQRQDERADDQDEAGREDDVSHRSRCPSA